MLALLLIFYFLSYLYFSGDKGDDQEGAAATADNRQGGARGGSYHGKVVSGNPRLPLASNSTFLFSLWAFYDTEQRSTRSGERERERERERDGRRLGAVRRGGDKGRYLRAGLRQDDKDDFFATTPGFGHQIDIVFKLVAHALFLFA